MIDDMTLSMAGYFVYSYFGSSHMKLLIALDLLRHSFNVNRIFNSRVDFEPLVLRIKYFEKIFRPSGMVPVFMGVEDVPHRLIVKVAIEAVHNDFRVGRVDEHQRIFNACLNDVRVIILEERYSEYTE